MSSITWTCSIQDLAQATGGQILSQPFAEFHLVGTDTRKPLDGMLFVALKGDQFDAHNFVAKAVEQKARVILVHEWREEWKPLLEKATFVKVADTLKALQNFAHFWRRKQKFKVMGITGSNGKTSTKEFTYQMVKDFIPTYASKGSFNNHWGLPLSILAAGPETKLLILEMGMNHPGELFRLCQIAEPDIVAVTTVGRAHIGELGSQAKIAEAKEEIYLASPKAIHVFNVDNEWTMRMQARSTAQQIKFSSFKPVLDVFLRAQRLTWDGLDIVGSLRGVEGRTWVHVLGRQNTNNLMCACGLALAVGMQPQEIWTYLSTIHDVAWGRNQLVALNNGAKILFDAYNANPDSMSALLKNLYEMDVDGRKFLVVGDMKELGTFSEAAHEEIGEKAAAVLFEGILYVGENAKAFQRGLEKAGGKPNIFVTMAKFDPQIARDFANNFNAGDLVAVKASRGVELERVVETWPLQTPLGKKP